MAGKYGLGETDITNISANEPIIPLTDFNFPNTFVPGINGVLLNRFLSKRINCPPEVEEQNKREKMNTPKLGLALGSGSARGWSHIGIIRGLAEMGIKPDIVCGCSAGALVGGIYAAGYMDELETWAKKLDWKEVFSLFDIRLTGGGVIVGDRLINFFKNYVGDQTTIESLPLPYASVATVLETGREVWLKEGLLLDAIRASMSFPGIMEPVFMGSKWLIDGGLVNPVPVSICRAMGADIIIAVNLNSDIVGRHFEDTHDPDEKDGTSMDEESSHSFGSKVQTRIRHGFESFISQIGSGSKKNKTPGLFEVIAGTVNIMQDRITRSRMAGDPPDIILEPRLRHLGLLEFYRAQEAIDEGFKCISRMKESINHLIIPKLKKEKGDIK